MRNKLSYNRAVLPPAINPLSFLVSFFVIGASLLAPDAAKAGDAPQWMHSLTSASLPSYDEKTNAVVLYSDINFTVVSADKTKVRVRRAYKILRPAGRNYGEAVVYF